MFKSYFKAAFRNLVKNKVFSVINIIGLSAGMAVAILIGLWIWDELSFDKYHQHYDRIAHVMQHETFNGRVNTGVGVPIPLGNELRTTYGSDFKQVVLSSWSMNSLVSAGDKRVGLQGNFMQQGAPDLLTLNMLKGTRSALKEHSTILLSQSLAKSLFGDADPIGKIVKINEDLVETVTGVYEDLPLNSSFKEVKFIAPFFDLTSWTQGNEDNWNNNSFQIFVQLADKADIDKVSAKIKSVKQARLSKEEAKVNSELFLQPMSKWHLYADFKNGVNTGGAIQYVWLFGIIGIFVLLLACINFMNLSTARSEKRAKEVGIRKAVGSQRSQLINQFFLESLLASFLSFVCALLLLISLLPFFNLVAGKQISIAWANPYFWAACIGFTIITGLLAGSYPAFYLSAFKPVKVLKGTFRAGPFAAVPRKTLVVLQFTVSIVLMIATIVVFRQVQYIQNRPIGYSREGLITIIMRTANYHNSFAAMRNELLASGVITEMAESNTPITENDHYDNSFDWQGKDPNEKATFNTIGVTTEYGKTVGWQLKAGRDFSASFAADTFGLILNETAVKYMGLKNPVGEVIKWGGRSFTILGVVNDVVMENPYEPVKQSVFHIKGNDDGGILNIRLNPKLSLATALGRLQAVCAKYSPAEPFSYQFVDEDYASKFTYEKRIGKLSVFFTVLALFISALGLFGMASFMAEQRVKEIGIRRLLGATVFNLWSLLSKDFVMLVIIALCIATPAAYFFMHNWLQHYTYRTNMSWWIFALTGSGAIIITLLTVSYQSIKAALSNPIKSLKTE
ncbi:ABC-type antimicrobial peptide transport system, permease component [Chitinophaga rupis]|uniref:ABC-type antimicrobial peptide transport system, permease component n=1 Tax=Chitinophaga rupis TaxID=573321 RepID=A0A1H7YR30_9BACT|nr:ABC transporter permease [Chitinophaga rupis]SEM47758.1 ABC-type antimicrobial peptide transport system, permease component [Chitinophaga rupis]